MNIYLKNHYCDKCKSRNLSSEGVAEPVKLMLPNEETKFKLPDLKYYRRTCNECRYFIEYRSI